MIYALFRLRRDHTVEHLKVIFVGRFQRRMSFKRSDPVSKWKPSEARYEFRTNPELEGLSTSGFCMGYLQANLTILPSSLADDFEQFCELNKAPCPLLYRSKRGELSAGILARESDMRYENIESKIQLLARPELESLKLHKQ